MLGQLGPNMGREVPDLSLNQDAAIQERVHKIASDALDLHGTCVRLGAHCRGERRSKVALALDQAALELARAANKLLEVNAGGIAAVQQDQG